MIEFRTLGTLDLRAADGRELHSLLAQPKRIALLTYLCIAEPRGYHRRDTLLGLFWPDSDQDHARTSLRKSLHFLRHALGEDAIVSRGDEEIAVDFGLLSCDAVSFGELIRNNQLAEAVTLYGGDLLTGFFLDDAAEFDQWLQAERNRLRASAARAAYGAAEQLEKKGEIVAATNLARRALDLADTDQRTLRKLMALQYAAGDPSSAIDTYEAFSRRLATEYQTRPQPETQALVEQIRSGSRDSPPNRSSAPSAVAGTVRGKEHGRGVRMLLYAVTVLAIVISGTAIWGRMRPAAANQVVRYTWVIDSTEAMVRSTPWSGRIAISPDGSLLAYIGGPRSQLLLQPRSQLHAIAVAGTEGAASPFFSPDGKHVGFLREGIVQIASVRRDQQEQPSGGPPITVSDSLNGVSGASWGSDNFIYVDGLRLVRVEAKPGAVPRWFTTLDTVHQEAHHSWPDVLPNGKGVLFTVVFSGRNGVKGVTSFAIAVADIPSGKHRLILDDAIYARYATSGYLVYVTTNKALMVAPFDQNSMSITGKPTALTAGMLLGTLGSADVAVSATGTLIYATGAGEGNQELVWVTRDGKEQAVDSTWSAFYMGTPRLSPDGKSVAETRIEDAESRATIWIKRLDRGTSIKLTDDTRWSRMPAWKPDGKSVTFSSSTSETGQFDLWTQRADGSAQAVMQVHGKSSLYNPRWSPDAKWLIYQTDVLSPGSGDILAIRPGIDTAPVPVVATRFSEISPALSPDGRWLAYVSNETGVDEIYVVPFPNSGTPKRAISSGGGTEPVWSHRGSELFYRNASEDLVAVEIITSPTFSLGHPTVLFSAAKFTPLRFTPQYAVAPDDRRFLMIRPLETSTPDKLIVVENWFEELKSKSRR